jgi:hypothetical protein
MTSDKPAEASAGHHGDAADPSHTCEFCTPEPEPIPPPSWLTDFIEGRGEPEGETGRSQRERGLGSASLS